MDWDTPATVLPTALSATVYCAVQTVFVATMLGRPPAEAPSRAPRTSILKPLRGADDELRENLESFARLDYPSFELLLGVSSASDPAVPVARAFLAAHPEIDARLVLTGPPDGPAQNPKVAQLIGLTRAARSGVLVVSDANVRVPPTYLTTLLAALLRPGVGLVSSVIAGTGERSLGAALDHLQLMAYLAPAIVAANRLSLRPITVGKSMAMRRADLETVGGWESVSGVLAEDDVLAQRFDAFGFGVELCLEPIENRNVAASVGATLDRHSRWTKMRRAIHPLGFAVEPLLSPLVVATLVAVAAPSTVALRAWVAALALQALGAWTSLTVLRPGSKAALALLEPLRAAMSLSCWCIAGLTRRVTWRGNAFYIGAGTRLVPVEEAAEAGDAGGGRAARRGSGWRAAQRRGAAIPIDP